MRVVLLPDRERSPVTPAEKASYIRLSMVYYLIFSKGHMQMLVCTEKVRDACDITLQMRPLLATGLSGGYSFFFPLVLVMELRTLYVPGKCSATDTVSFLSFFLSQPLHFWWSWGLNPVPCTLGKQFTTEVYPQRFIY